MKYVVDTTDPLGRDKPASDLTGSEAGAPEYLGEDELTELQERLSYYANHERWHWGIIGPGINVHASLKLGRCISADEVGLITDWLLGVSPRSQ